jgi:hypothetical protein
MALARSPDQETVAPIGMPAVGVPTCAPASPAGRPASAVASPPHLARTTEDQSMTPHQPLDDEVDANLHGG